jgi:dienelactone hydrolase
MSEDVVYKVPNMDKVEVRGNVKYHTSGDTPLTMDIYYPPYPKSDSQLPAVIFVFGYADSTALKKGGPILKDLESYISWSRLTAASGLVAITYETEQPDADIEELIKHIRRNSASLNIDGDRIGIWSCSANVPVALSVLMDEPREYLKCAVLYYGCMLDWGDSHTVAEAAERIGFVYPDVLKNAERLRWDVPLFIVRAGLEQYLNRYLINETIDHFLGKALSKNMPVTFINYSDGQHGFDTKDDNDKSRQIIKQTLEFMRAHLLVKA